MTQTEFFAHVNSNNYADNINIWYTGSNPSTVLGMSIPTVTPSGQDISAKLAQAEQVTIPQPGGLSIILTITSRSQNQSPDGTRYYIYLTVPITTTAITQATVAGDIYLSPDIDSYEFSVSPYNVLGGSVEENRESNYIMKADKSTAGNSTVPVGYSGPVNIYALLSGSAELAVVQDSNYSITGWSNARYNGTKTDVYDYQSPPLLSGTVFQGSNYPTTVPTSQIQTQVSSSTTIYSDYFYAGTEDTPGYSRKGLLYVISGSSVPSTSTDFFIKPDSSFQTNLTGSLSVGDLIQVGGADEIMRVTVIGVPPTLAPGTLRLRVERNINNTTNLATVNSPDAQGIYKINPVQIYELELNRLNGVVRGYIAVRDTREILKLDSNGFVIGRV
jgi:hypothetical protein